MNKSPQGFLFGSGGGSSSPYKLVNTIKTNGGFAYAFNQKGAGSDNAMSFVYMDNVTRGDIALQTFFGAVTYFEWEYYQDRMRLNKPGLRTGIKILPAKAGYIAVLEYTTEEEQLELRLERINY